MIYWADADRFGPEGAPRRPPLSGISRHFALVQIEGAPPAQALGPEFSVWGGDGGMYQLDCLRVGAAGMIPGSDLEFRGSTNAPSLMVDAVAIAGR